MLDMTLTLSFQNSKIYIKYINLAQKLHSDQYRKMTNNALIYLNHHFQEHDLLAQKEEDIENKKSASAAKMALDFVAGCIGGCAGVLVGHPLDTIKVHIQTQDPRNPIYRGTWHCATTLVRQESFRSLYRGISSPMAGISMVNAIVFGVYGNVQRRMNDSTSLKSHFIAGSLAGFVQSIVCTPMELAKTRIQLQHHDTAGVHHKGPMSCLRYIIRTEGIKGIFRGLGITAARDVPGFASYFVSYEYMMSLVSPTGFNSLIAGGFAGMFSWVASYPMDVVKTVIQADGMTSKPKYKGVMQCARLGYQADGIHFFVRGLSSTLIRAFPMNATCFFVVSWILRWSNKSPLDVVVQTEPLAFMGLSSTPLCHIHKHDYKEMERRRTHMVRNLAALGAFSEAICQTEVEELANEFYPKKYDYYIFDENRLQESNIKRLD